MNEEIKNKAVQAFVKNPYWKEIYDGAPEKVKKYYEASFAFAEDLIDSKTKQDAVLAAYADFDDSDWDYVIEKTANKMGKWGLRQAREKYGRKNG